MYLLLMRSRVLLTPIIAICAFLVFGVDIANAGKKMRVDVVNINELGHTKKVHPCIDNDLEVTVSDFDDETVKIEGALVQFATEKGIDPMHYCYTLSDGKCTLKNIYIDCEFYRPEKVFVVVSKATYDQHKRRIKLAKYFKEANIKDCDADDFLLPSHDLNGNEARDPGECIYYDSPSFWSIPDVLFYYERSELHVKIDRDAGMKGWHVKFYWAWPGVGLDRNTDWVEISDENQSTGWPEDLPGEVWTTWTPSAHCPPEWHGRGDLENHFCFFVEVYADDDPTNLRNFPQFDNNLAQDNFEHCFWDDCEPPGPFPSPSPKISEFIPPPEDQDCFEVKYNFFVKNPDSLNEADVILNVVLQDWPPDMQFSLTSNIDPDPDFMQIDEYTYSFKNMAPLQKKTADLILTSPNCDDVGTINVFGMIDSLDIGGISVQTMPSECPIIEIEKKHDVLQGHYIDVSITAQGGIYEMGGFDFLIAYEASALAFIEANPGQLLEDCGWEYFTYRHGPTGNCGDACPSGMLRIIALAETNNGPNHPSCFGPTDCDEYELAKLKFFVSNDRRYECQFMPIYFYWDDCSDNTYSSIDGEILYIERRVYDHEDNIIWDETDDDQFPEDARIPYVGAPDYCLNTDPTKPPIRRCPSFKNGGLDIICSDSIDVRGDINCNGIPNEIADAVMFANFFIQGLSAFGDHIEASIAASDVNADGITLSVADLVYLIRVIIGDAQPYPKVAPYTDKASVSALVNHSAVGVSTTSRVDIGAGYFVFEHSGLEIGEPHLINGASDMTLLSRDSDGLLKILVYSMEPGTKITAGTESIFAIPVSGTGNIELIETQLSDYDGNLLEAVIEKQAILPQKYALHQNYPNPFNATTTIFYELPVASPVRIEVFNVLGQKITTLLDQPEEAGIHSVQWNGADESGRTVSSGVYFYRITTDTFTDERKMILMK